MRIDVDGKASQATRCIHMTIILFCLKPELLIGSSPFNLITVLNL